MEKLFLSIYIIYICIIYIYIYIKYIYIYIYIYIYKCKYKYTNTYVHIWCVYTHIHIIHMHTCTYTHIHTSAETSFAVTSITHFWMMFFTTICQSVHFDLLHLYRRRIFVIVNEYTHRVSLFAAVFCVQVDKEPFAFQSRKESYLKIRLYMRYFICRSFRGSSIC